MGLEGTPPLWPLSSPIPRVCSGSMSGLAPPVGAPKVLEWDEVKQLEAGVGQKQRHEESSVPLVQPSKVS